MLLAAVTEKQKWLNKNCRQLAVVGEEALEKLQSISALILGTKGTGAEIAKNLILMGVAKVIISDPGIVQWSDLSSNDSNVGQNRAESVLKKLQELNEDCLVSTHNGPIDLQFISNFKVVVLSEIHNKNECIRINNLCREASKNGNTVCNVICGSLGVFGSVFVDFGEKFTSLDIDGEPIRQSFMQSISTCGNDAQINRITLQKWLTQSIMKSSVITDSKREKKAVVCLEKETHGLGYNDQVKITECTGDFATLNGKIFNASGKTPASFEINADTSTFRPYEGAGWWQQIKSPVDFFFDPLESFYGKPLPFGKWQPQDDFFNRQPLCFLVLEALQNFFERYQRLPWPYNEEDCAIVYQNAVALNDTFGEDKIDFDEDFVKSLIGPSAGDLCPIAAIIGGVVANQCISGISQKWSPINQWFFIEATKTLPTKPLKETDIVLKGSRYDGQIAVYGNAFTTKLSNLNYFLVGAGAIGCELLKNFALMGLACGPNGKVTVTDMDTIEVSNLTRQFLFRSQHVGSFKSKVAAEMAKNQNPALNAIPLITKAARQTENIFDDDFWFGLSGVANALDNFEARRYINSKCLFFKKPLIDSGTSGTQCESCTVQPGITLGWGTGAQEPTQETFEECTIHSLPNKIQHTISYARSVGFQQYFVTEPEDVAKYLTIPNYIESLTGSRKVEAIQALCTSFLERPTTFEACLEWAFRLFEKEFYFKARDQLVAYPLDKKEEDGGSNVRKPGEPRGSTKPSRLIFVALYWSGAQRPPSPQVFSVENPLHLDFIIALSHLRAYTMGVIPTEFKPQSPQEWQQRVQSIKAHLSKLPLSEYTAANVRGNEAPKYYADGGLEMLLSIEENPDGSIQIENRSLPLPEDQIKILNRLPKDTPNITWRPRSCNFEKDNDENFHIDAVHAWSNNRAVMYGIKEESRFRTKHIVGNIIPAIITATAFISGLSCLEIYKQHQPGKKLDDFCSNIANLASSTVQRFPPLENKTKQIAKIKFSAWSRIDLPQKDYANGPMSYTIRDLYNYFLNVCHMKIETMGAGTAIFWMGNVQDPDFDKSISALYQEIVLKGQPIPSNLKHIPIEISASDRTGKKIDATTDPLPPIALWIGGLPAAKPTSNTKK